MRLHSYLQTVQQILDLYDGDVPFALWLKNFFKEHKKYGSGDRRHITHLAYSYFRMGNAFAALPVEEKIKLGVYLCAEEASDLLQAINESWNNLATLPPAEKLARFDAAKEIQNIFPFPHLLSAEIEKEAFHLSFLRQPPVYLRLRPGKGQKVKETFLAAGIGITEIAENCIAVSSNTKVDELIQLDADAVVQDRSSQRVLEVLPEEGLKGKRTVWDCCAASGGKSLLVWDAFKKVALTATDIRPNILHNLRNRFNRAGIQHYKALVADVAQGAPFKEKFDLVLCDAPCSGSGTWGRTPEQLRYFEKSRLEHYVQLQKSIVTNAAKNVRRGGALLYSTCSVFTQENEAVVDFIQHHLPLQLHRYAYLKGYHNRSDTLFAAAFTPL